MDLILQNATIVTQNKKKEIFKGDIRIENNVIKEIASSIKVPDIPKMDLSGLVIVPGFIQTHVHLCQALFRNLADDLELLDWLEQRIWPMEMAHDADSLRASAQLGLAEMLKSGVTTVLDMGNGNHMDAVFEEIGRSGIRGFSGKVMMDQGEQAYKESTEKVIAETVQLIEKWHGSENGRVHYALAPRFVLSCSDALWDEIKKLSETYHLIIHTHASENKKELALVREITGYNNVEYFVRKGLGSPKLCLAHCIWVTPEEINYLAEYQINVLHCPSANLKLGSGFAPVPKMLSEKINVSLGSDGAPCNNNLDIFIDMRLAALIHKPNFGVTSIKAENILDMVTINGARTVGLQDKIGSIEPGKFADLTILDLNKVHSIPADNLYSQIVYSAQSSNVLHVMVNGKWVVKDGRILFKEESKIVEDSWKECRKLLTRLK